MLRKLTSSRRVPALLSFALLLAMLAPVSASATGNGGGSGGEQYTNHDFEISLKSKWSNDFKNADWLKPIFSMFREHVERSGDHFRDYASKYENKRWWGMHHRSGGFAKSHYRWGYRDHGSVSPVVPEPSTAVLMLLGLAGLAVSSHRVRS